MVTATAIPGIVSVQMEVLRTVMIMLQLFIREHLTIIVTE